MERAAVLRVLAFHMPAMEAGALRAYARIIAAAATRSGLVRPCTLPTVISNIGLDVTGTCEVWRNCCSIMLMAVSCGVHIDCCVRVSQGVWRVLVWKG